MNSKVTTNSQLSATEPKKNKIKQTTRTGTELQKRISHGGLSTERGRGDNGGKGTRNNSLIKWRGKKEG